MSAPIVLITWYDHVSGDEWYSLDDVLKEPPVLQAVGFVVYEDERVVTLAQCIEPPSGEVTMQFLILKSCIVSRQELRQ